MKNIPCIGLFGTCGNSTWRKDFINGYNAFGIRYFNPQVDNWTPECADIEAQHLKRDEIILFPVTGETYGTGSLAETGFSIIQAIQSNFNRWIILLIADDLDEALKADEIAYKESIRARRLVKAHLNANPHPNVYVVNSMTEMYDLSLKLHDLTTSIQEINDQYKVA